MTPQDAAVAKERDYLVRAREELCTALTTLRSNVDLAHSGLRKADVERVLEHLSEMDSAVERLVRLAHQMRSWHDTT